LNYIKIYYLKEYGRESAYIFFAMTTLKMVPGFIKYTLI